MAPIAIAGGTSFGVGRAIVLGLLSETPHHHPIVLGRASTPIPTWLKPLLDSGKVTLRHVDYSSAESMETAFAGVDTLISALLIPNETFIPTQLALLKAAVAAGVSRYAPSEFGVGIKATARIPMMQPRMEVWKACEESGVEWTRFNGGLFMNYLGHGAVRNKEEAFCHRGSEPPLLFDGNKLEAELPIDENGDLVDITLTETMDVGRFVARACDLEKWDETDLTMVGETMRVDKVIEIVERVTGQKWKTTKVSEKEYRARQAKEKDPFMALWWDFSIMATKNEVGEGIMDGKCNKLFPDLKPMTVDKYAQTFLV